MEHIEGPSLEQFVAARSPLPPDDALELLRQIFRGVAAAHASGAAHGDLKPENVLVVDGGGVPDAKLLDAKPGLGTPLWGAPERGITNDAPSPRSDVWSLGLIAFFVLTGRSYWRNGAEESLVDLTLELLKNPIERPSVRVRELGIERGLPSGFDDWFLRAVSRDPEARFEDAGTALVELTRVLDARGKDRFPLWLPLEIDELPGGVAMAHDLSDSGLQVVARGTLDVGIEVTVRVELPPGSGQVFERRARVVRSGKNAGDPDGLWPMQLALALGEPIPNVAELLRGLRLP